MIVNEVILLLFFVYKMVEKLIMLLKYFKLEINYVEVMRWGILY